MPPSSGKNSIRPVHWFFLRGLTREAEHWEEFPSHFQKAFPDATLHLLDLPGSGAHWKVSSPLTIERNVAFLRREYKKIIPEKQKAECYMFALSLGGMVTVEWLRRHPEDFAGAVLVNTSLRQVSPLYRRMSPSAMARVTRLVLHVDPAERERGILALTSNKGPYDESFIARRVKSFEQHPFTRANFLRQVVAAARYQPPAQRPSVPILLLSSLGDRLVHPNCSSDLKEIWKLDLKTHPTAGHDLPLDDPTWTVKAVQEWLVGASRPRAARG